MKVFWALMSFGVFMSALPGFALADCGLNYYPPAAVRANEEGTVVFNVHVTEDGSVAGVDIIQSSGYADLDDATIECVKQNWRFRPAMQDGKPVAATKKFQITWKLR